MRLSCVIHDHLFPERAIVHLLHCIHVITEVSLTFLDELGEMDLNETPLNRHPRKLLAGMAIFLAMWSQSTAFAASPLLRCEISQGGEAYIVDFLPSADPYTVEAKNINGKFRFKAIMLGNEQLIESIKIYTYYQEQHQVVLLHEARYVPPFSSSLPSPAALTGVNYLYSPRLEEELQYGCTLLEAQP